MDQNPESRLKMQIFRREQTGALNSGLSNTHTNTHNCKKRGEFCLYNRRTCIIRTQRGEPEKKLTRKRRNKKMASESCGFKKNQKGAQQAQRLLNPYPRQTHHAGSQGSPPFSLVTTKLHRQHPNARAHVHVSRPRRVAEVKKKQTRKRENQQACMRSEHLLRAITCDADTLAAWHHY